MPPIVLAMVDTSGISLGLKIRSNFQNEPTCLFFGVRFAIYSQIIWPTLLCTAVEGSEVAVVALAVITGTVMLKGTEEEGGARNLFRF